MDQVLFISAAKLEENRDKKQRSKNLFNSDTLSDVKFVVRGSQHGENGSKRSKIVIPAHKFVLSVSSRVFFSMFCGDMAEIKEEIDLPDCEYDGIIELLRYIYTDEVCLSKINVLQVLYVAEKYLIPCLAIECIKFLEKNVDPSNVFCVLEHAQQYGKKDLLLQCWYLMDRKTEEVLESSEFLMIKKTLLEQLVVRNTLNIKEIELFRAVDRWAEKECERQNLKVEASAKRRILGEQIVKSLRFPTMKQSDFVETVINSKLLTQQETSDITKYFSSSLSTPVGFLDAERGGSCLRCCRSKASNMSSNLYNKPENPYCVDLTVDKDIMLYGVGVFGNKYSDFSVALQVFNDDDSVLATKTGTFTSFRMESQGACGFYYGFDVLFDVPVTLKKNIKYCFKAAIGGPHSRVEGLVVNYVQCGGVTFKFKNPKDDDDNPTNNTGYGDNRNINDDLDIDDDDDDEDSDDEDYEEEDDHEMLSQIADILFKVKELF